MGWMGAAMGFGFCRLGNRAGAGPKNPDARACVRTGKLSLMHSALTCTSAMICRGNTASAKFLWMNGRGT